MSVVYVQNKKGMPLMPTGRFGRVRHLLERKMARVVNDKPFTIRLLYDSTEYTQPLYGGIDPGRENIGAAVVTAKGEAVYLAHVQGRNREVAKLMAERKAHRQASRRGERLRRKRRAGKCGTVTTFPDGRHLPGYKDGALMLKDIVNSEARFNNRKRPGGWMTPTTRHCVRTHVNLVATVEKILPVTHWSMEINRFSFMQLEDGTIRGSDFQNGKLKGYDSFKDYVRARQDGKCACCGKPGIEEFHHIVPRSANGSNMPDNYAGLCKKCHDDIHKGRKELKLKGKKKIYAGTSVLNQSISRIGLTLRQRKGKENFALCSAYETAAERNGLGWKKDKTSNTHHHLDAYLIACISFGLIPDSTVQYMDLFRIQQYRNHDRSIIKAQRKRTYYIKGQKNAVAADRKPPFRKSKPKIPALSEWYEFQVSKYGVKEADRLRSQLRVKTSQRYYNNRERYLPGSIFYIDGKRYILSSILTNGKYLNAIGEFKEDEKSKNLRSKNFPSKIAKFSPRKYGFVYI